MLLKELLEDIQYEVTQGNDMISIDYIACHAGRVKCNSLFICINGFKFNGHEFIEQAIDNGATAVLVQEEVKNVRDGITVIKISNTRETMPLIANRFFGDPSSSFNLIGITGTNGKTSVSIITAAILETVEHKVGVIGTIDNRIGNRALNIEKTNPTTPDSIELGLIMKEMKDEKVNDVVMEVSSMSLELHRVDQCKFDIGVFTNLTQDHLDDHKSMENYKRAKLRLFQLCKKAVINIDDPVSTEILHQAKCDIITYGIDKDADIRATDIIIKNDCTLFTVNFKGNKKDVEIKIPGKFSVYNFLAAVGACYCSGLSLDEIVLGIKNVVGVRGRFETIISPVGYSVIIDYAHTPDALQNVLNTVKEFVQGNIITVFGCGGDRDKTKRPIMGEIAGSGSNYCIITSDNPRTEEPLSILEDIEYGVLKTKCGYEKEVDRKLAIHSALKRAKCGDVIIIAGKGHENYQIFKDKTIHFDDAEVVNEYIKDIS